MNYPNSPFPNYSYIGIMPKTTGEIGNIAGIYVIFCNTSGQKYIGQSRNIANRWRGHLSTLRNNTSSCPKLQQSWNKHGEKAHVFSLLTTTQDLTKLNEKEKWFINSIKPELNSTQIVSGSKMSEESKAKMRKNHADVSGSKNPMYGVKFMGEKNHMFGRKRSDISEFNTRTKKGKTISKEHKNKISKSLLGNTRRKDAKKI